jgi:ankyrin repeat protein
MEGQFETAKLLVSLGAQLEAEDIFGNTALHFAASEGNIEAVHFLIEVSS